ncbi:dodecin [Marinobacterium jannaschii]|uniref:dodecin n=1 Tax=Marinobacterium jannaschii TaxID=64970 RepID=UPI000483DB89|nr:dodecin [Marinobacterium jannaschii]
MSDHVYKKIDVVGSSAESIDDAIRQAVSKASESIDHLEWFEVDEIRGHISQGEVAHFQVVMKVGFRLN